MIWCKDSRCEKEPCYSLKGDRCLALAKPVDSPCPFYKERSIRQKELNRMARRVGAKYYGI